MTSRGSNSNLLLFFIFLIKTALSDEYCHYYFKPQFLKAYSHVKSIPLIKTEDPKDAIECSLRNINHKDFSDLVSECYDETDENYYQKQLPKCEGRVYRNVSFFLFMCMMARDMSVTIEDCKGLDLACQHLHNGSPILYDSTPTTASTTTPPPPPTTATLPQRTSTGLALKTTPGRLSPSANPASIQANGTSDKHSGNNHPAASEYSESMKIALVCSVILNISMVPYILYTCFFGRRENQQLSPMLLPDANWTEAESETLKEVKIETPLMTPRLTMTADAGSVHSECTAAVGSYSASI